ncbi:cyclic nucleotide-binding domain protein (macronuclear) [Tetrahymena thermophila SB210]|uniref:Cyclic nucleotide-binding domain protein n=1 Tax=Tetrahymena thermophila (strain SB210) TaxID=312017 RepID=Q22UJ2_TETTS|nr:cyclic nucleotide-binding domain protein [Tetrahymena thermophila SB210]EAR88978.2 cyclic nucleotide-binding domain protein [Tetrahymena thermophila SB210]|eukprot:XP_001009223.2 cyclic nucleotide-binding domain protein [Tetrahymena thermophila SB210]
MSLNNSAIQNSNVENLQNSNSLDQSKQLCDNLTEDQIQRLNGEKLIEAGIAVLNKIPTKRAKSDIEILIRLTEEVQFFKNHFGQNHHSMLQEYSEHFGYQKCSRGDIVFKQGDQGDKFYLILRGQVKVLVSVKRQLQQNPQEKADKNKKVKNEKEEQLEIKVLKSGETFGELAIIDSKPRGATIVCMEDCDFIVFEKISFIKILKDQETEKLRNEINQLTKIYLFKDFSLNLLKNLYLLFSVNSYQRGDVIYREGDESDKLYIIREGEFKVSKKFEYNLDEAKINKLNNNEKMSKVKILDIGLIGKFQSLGEEEFFVGIQREVTVTCVSKDAVIMAINKKDLLKKMSYDQNSVRLMQSRAKDKFDFRQSKLKQLQEKFQEDEESVVLKNYKRNILKISKKIEEVIDSNDINQFSINSQFCVEKTTLSKKQQQENFVIPDQNTIRSNDQSFESQEADVNQNNISKIGTPRSQRQGNYTPGRDSLFKLNSPKQNQTLNNSQLFRQNSLNSSHIKSHDNSAFLYKNSPKQSESNQDAQFANFSQFLQNMDDSSSSKQFNYPVPNLLQNLQRSQQKNSIFFKQGGNKQKPKKKILLRINEKLKDCTLDDIKKQQQTSFNQENTVNQLINFNVQKMAEENRIQISSSEIQTSRSSSSNSEQVSEQKQSIKSIQKNNNINSELDGFNFLGIQNLKHSQSTRNHNSKQINFPGQESKVNNNCFAVKSQGNILNYSMTQSQQSALNNFQQQQEIDQSYDQNLDQQDVSRKISICNNDSKASKNDSYLSDENSKTPSKIVVSQNLKIQNQKKVNNSNNIIIYQEKTRNSILTDKCRDFLNMDNKIIQDKAKAKSVMKNPFLYIDEFPLPKNVSTNLEDQDVDRLIQEKIINQVVKGNNAKRNSFFMQPLLQQQIQQKAFHINDEKKINEYEEFQYTPSNQQASQRLFKNQEESFQAFYNQSKEIPAQDNPPDQKKNQTPLETNRSLQLLAQTQQSPSSKLRSNKYSYSIRPLVFQTNIFHQDTSELIRPLSSQIGSSKNKTSHKKANTQLDQSLTKSNTARPLSSVVQSSNDKIVSRKHKNSISGQLKTINFDDLSQSPILNHFRQLSSGRTFVLEKQNSQQPFKQELNQKIEELIEKKKQVQNQQAQTNFVQVQIQRPKTSQTVFKHDFKAIPCQQVNNQVYHVYNCKGKNDGKCLCKSNHLNLLPLKFRTDLIMQNQKAIKKNCFSVRMQGKIYQNAV